MCLGLVDAKRAGALAAITIDAPVLAAPRDSGLGSRQAATTPVVDYAVTVGVSDRLEKTLTIRAMSGGLERHSASRMVPRRLDSLAVLGVDDGAPGHAPTAD